MLCRKPNPYRMIPFLSVKGRYTGTLDSNYKATFVWMSLLAAVVALSVTATKVGFGRLRDKEHDWYDTMRALHVIASLITLAAGVGVTFAAGYLGNKGIAYCCARTRAAGLEEGGALLNTRKEESNNVVILENRKKQRKVVCDYNLPKKKSFYPKTTGACAVLLAMGISAITVVSTVGFKKGWASLVDSDPSHYIALALMLVVAPTLVGGVSVIAHKRVAACYFREWLEGVDNNRTFSCLDRKGWFTGDTYATFS